MASINTSNQYPQKLSNVREFPLIQKIPKIMGLDTPQAKKDLHKLLYISSAHKYISLPNDKNKEPKFLLSISPKRSDNSMPVDFGSEPNKTYTMKYIGEFDDKLRVISRRVPLGVEKVSPFSKNKRNDFNLKNIGHVNTPTLRENDSNFFKTSQNFESLKNIEEEEFIISTLKKNDSKLFDIKNSRENVNFPLKTSIKNNVQSFDDSTFLEKESPIYKSSRKPKISLRKNSLKPHLRLSPKYTTTKTLDDYASKDEFYTDNSEIFKEMNQTPKNIFEPLNPKLRSSRENISKTPNEVNLNNKLLSIIKSLNKFTPQIPDLSLKTEENISQRDEDIINNKNFIYQNSSKALFSYRTNNLQTVSKKNEIFKRTVLRLNPKKKEENNAQKMKADDTNKNEDVTNPNNKSKKTILRKQNVNNSSDSMQISMNSSKINDTVFHSYHQFFPSGRKLKQTLTTKKDIMQDLLNKKKESSKLLAENFDKNYYETPKKSSKLQESTRYLSPQRSLKEIMFPATFYSFRITGDMSSHE